MFPRNRKWLWLLLTAVLAFQGCWRDPETVKRRYVASGDKYFAQGKYKEASLMYRSALKKDAKFGEAYSKLGETELRRGEIREAIGALRRAVDLLPRDENPAGRLADIYLAIYATPKNHNAAVLKEVQQLADQLLKHNPNSYHGQRLTGFLSICPKPLPLSRKPIRCVPTNPIYCSRWPRRSFRTKNWIRPRRCYAGSSRRPPTSLPLTIS